MADDGSDFGAAASGDLPATLDTLNLRARDLELGANAFARAMTQAFSRAAIDGKRLEDVLKSLALRLSDLSLRLALKPLTQGLAGGIENLFASLFGNAKPFAQGGVISTPHYFPAGGGRLGVAGEAGPEAILPLARGADGRLGVAAGGAASPAHVTINIATPDAASFRHSETYVTGLIARAVARGQRGL